jgi:exosortase
MSEGSVGATAPVPAAAARSSVAAIAAGVGILAAVAVAYRGLLSIGSGPPSSLQGAERVLFEPTANSPQLVVAATAWFLVSRWGRLRAAIRSGERSLLSLLLLAPAAALLVWAHYVWAPELLVPSLSLLLLGGALWLGGGRALRAILPPALFLLFLMPIPVALVNRFMYPLQIATAEVTTALLRLVGFDVTTHGDLMFYNGYVFQVIEACSGLRITETIFMSSFLYVSLFWRNRLQSALLVLASPLVGLAMNLARVATVVLNPLSHIAAVHTAQGLVAIVIAVFVLALIDSLLTKLLGNRVDPPARQRVIDRGPPPLGALLALLLLVTSLAGVTFALRPWQASAEPAAAPLSALPSRIDGWNGRRLKLESEFLGSVSFAEWIHRRYERDGAQVDVLLGANPRLDPAVDFLSPKVDLPGAGWVVEDRRTVELPGVGTPVELLRLRDPVGSRALAYRWFEGVGSSGEELTRSLLSLDRSPFRRPGRAIVVRVLTPLGREPGVGEAAARERLDGIATEVATFLGKSAPTGRQAHSEQRPAERRMRERPGGLEKRG